jgi:hypothetical protein
MRKMNGSCLIDAKAAKTCGNDSGMVAMDYLSEVSVEANRHNLTEIAPISVCS